MADVEDRIFDLTDEPAPLDTHVLVIDDPTFTEPKKVTKANLFADEVADRSTADTNIETGAGLNAGGTLSPEPTSNYLKNADYIAAGYNINLRNSTLLLDAAIANIAAADEIIRIIDLSSAEILASGTAITKITNPGTGLIYHWYECDAAIIFGTTPYVSAGANGIDVIFTGGSDQIVRLPKTFLESAATDRKKFFVLSHTLLTDTAIDVIAPDGNPINGDSSIVIRLEGRIQAELVHGGVVPVSNCCVQPDFDDFVDADLTALGNLEIHHGRNTQNIMLAIKDNTGAWIAATFTVGDETGADPFNYITVPIGLGIIGTWSWFIISK